MKKISRAEAIGWLCLRELESLDFSGRESCILDWWGIDEYDVEFSLLPVDLQCLILANEDPPLDSENIKYDALILIALSARYKGVTNSFIEEMLLKAGVGSYEVCGEVELLEVCPCCNYRTLDARGEYDICRLCNWEDNGINKSEQYSGPNHKTLGEAQKQFAENVSKFMLEKWAKA